VVIVEDNPADVMLLRWALENRGVTCDLEVIDHGDIAMAYAEGKWPAPWDGPPSVILVDINLPGYDGFQLVEAFRANASFSGSTIGMYSSSDDEADRTRALNAGASFFIEKPVDLQGLDRLAVEVAAVLARSDESTPAN
jgi:DNA-binding response OmpR family regulator